jgi:hypothetical protein
MQQCSVGALSEVWGELMRAAGATERLVELLEGVDTVQAPTSPQPAPEPAQGRLRFEGVSFRYPSRPGSEALADVGFDVAPGETVALGGLIRSTVDQTRSGIPGLRDIPILGALLGSTEANDGRTELLVLITPRIVRNSEEARALTAELHSRLRGLDPQGATRATR